ncbi:MAG TPA: helix-turn-helix domain-containing protein [Bacteroidales bacterium]|nr:helix-turn-helix domain-containing protein [Bacteroidales bacterium]
MDYQKIKEALAARNISIKRFAEEKLGMTEAGFHQAMKNNTLKVRDLERICELLDLKVWYWYSEDIQEFFDESHYQRRENEKLREELIATQSKAIELLENEIKRVRLELMEAKVILSNQGTGKVKVIGKLAGQVKRIKSPRQKDLAN